MTLAVRHTPSLHCRTRLGPRLPGLLALWLTAAAAVAVSGEVQSGSRKTLGNPAGPAHSVPDPGEEIRVPEALFEGPPAHTPAHPHSYPSDVYPDGSYEVTPIGVPLPVVPHFRRGSGLDESRHRGFGQPLQGTSWLNRPLHAGWFLGGLKHDDPIAGVHPDDALLGGYRLGWDFDHFWGLEGRVAFARPQLDYTPARADLEILRDWYWDGHLVYYPWGDSRWRPYLSAGVGVATVSFEDANEQPVDETLLHLPIGAGVKYMLDRWLILRFDLTDNFALGSGPVGSMHNWSATLGVEVRFGARPTSYGPW